MSSCRSCEAPIVWAEGASGRPMPLDAAPAAAGRFVLVKGRARTATAEDDQLGRPRYTSHFATCPDADQFRRPR